MKVWTNNDFVGPYPIGTAAVVVANTAEQAAFLLNDTLIDLGLDPTAEPEQFVRLTTNHPRAVVLRDGNY